MKQILFSTLKGLGTLFGWCFLGLLIGYLAISLVVPISWVDPGLEIRLSPYYFIPGLIGDFLIFLYLMYKLGSNPKDSGF